MKKTVKFTKEERDKIWCFIVSTSFFQVFANKTYDTLKDTEEYKIVDQKVLIPYSDGAGEFKISLKSIQKHLEHQAQFKAIVALT